MLVYFFQMLMLVPLKIILLGNQNENLDSSFLSCFFSPLWYRFCAHAQNSPLMDQINIDKIQFNYSISRWNGIPIKISKTSGKSMHSIRTCLWKPVTVIFELCNSYLPCIPQKVPGAFWSINPRFLSVQIVWEQNAYWILSSRQHWHKNKWV